MRDLPGGILEDGRLRRSFRFEPLTGRLEAELEELAAESASAPGAVTAVLARVLAELGGREPTEQSVRDLSVGDRQFLIRQLAGRLDDDVVWLTARCEGCGADFDLRVVQSAMPVKEAGEGYPYASVETSTGRCRFRVPNGGDQEALAALPDDCDAVRLLAERCRVDPPGSRELAEEDLPAIEAALEAIAPEVALAARTRCPECSLENEVAVEPLLCLSRRRESIFSEVHRLASAYHWAESEILAMSHSRRRRYLDLTERASPPAGA